MPAPLLTRSPGHIRDFIRACKVSDPACSHFDVAAPFVEWMLLGVIALRHEGKLEYDPEKMRIPITLRPISSSSPISVRGGSSTPSSRNVIRPESGTGCPLYHDTPFL